MEVDEVQPYYCEGLIHLSGLFESGVLSWDNENKKLNIDISDAKFEALKKWYITKLYGFSKTLFRQIRCNKF